MLASGLSLVKGASIGVTVGPAYGVDTNTGSWMLGYSFTASSAISVSGLGIFDNGDNGSGGLLSAHAVGLWDQNGTLIASATVPAGLGGTLISNFLFASITPIALTVGNTYTVGAELTAAQGDSWIADPAGFIVDPQIVYVSREYTTYSGTLVEPTLAGSNTIGYFGGNIEFGSASIPEPSSVFLVGLSLLVLAFAFRRKLVS
jgi:hypothetical protein